MNEPLQDIQTIIHTLKDALLSRLGEEVDLIFQYGSHIRGNVHHYSDIDISYVPVHEQTWECITVMVGEILVDLYPMHWSKLERMADFRDVSSTVLLNNRIIYRRNQAVEDRFDALGERIKTALHPEAKSEMLRRAMEIFSSAHEYYLLVLQAGKDHQLACLQHTQAILRTVFHCLAVCNQACIDTRKIDQVLALPKLPAGFETTVMRILATSRPTGLLAEVDTLLQTTRQMLLDEQSVLLRCETTFPAAFEAGYPELKRDLQGVILACERQDMFSLRSSLLSLLREMSLGIAQVMTGVEYSGFNSLGDYEQNLAALGFPPLLPLASVGDFAGLKRQCLAFDQRLREFLVERSVKLNTFATPGELQEYLQANLDASNER